MAMTQAQVLTELRERLEEDTASFYTDAMLRRYINEGVREIARRAEWKRTSESVAVSGGTQFYTAPTKAIRIYRIEYRITGSSSVYTLEYRDIHSLDRMWGVSQNTWSGIPEYYTLVSANPLSIELYPTPSSGGTLKVFYYEMPVDLATDGSDAATAITVPNGWEDAVIEYAAGLGHRRNKDTDAYGIAMDSFRQKLAGLSEMAIRYTDEATYIDPQSNPWGFDGLTALSW